MKKARPGHPGDLEEQRAAALTKACLECARRLGLTPAETAQVLTVSPGSLAAMKAQKRTLDGLSGEAERADALVRIGRRLAALLGEADTAWRSWIRREHPELGAKPVEIMLQRDGSLKIARFLEQSTSLSGH